MPIGCAASSNDLSTGSGLLQQSVLELEDYLFAGFADRDEEQLPAITNSLAGYTGRLVVSAPYVDLNPASPDVLIRSAARQRFEQACRFSLAIGANDIVFLSTYLPFIALDFYDEDWLERSIAFWQGFIEASHPDLTFILTNTFEFHPGFLVSLAEQLNCSKFRLGFDLGHFLVYSKISLETWVEAVKPWCHLVYVHSNDGARDTHDAPGEGKLTREMFSHVAAELGKDVIFLAKQCDKTKSGASIDWMQRSMRT